MMPCMYGLPVKTKVGNQYRKEDMIKISWKTTTIMK